MSVRRQLLIRTAWFCAALLPLAICGALVRFLGLRGQARRAASVIRGVAESIFPGIITLSPFGERYYVIRQISHPRSVRAGEEFAVAVTLENLGKETLEGRGGTHPVRLGTWEPADRISPFHHASAWILADRAGELVESVPPGQRGTFAMTFRAPAQPGSHVEEFAPVADGLGWFPGERIRLRIDVT